MPAHHWRVENNRKVPAITLHKDVQDQIWISLWLWKLGKHCENVAGSAVFTPGVGGSHALNKDGCDRWLWLRPSLTTWSSPDWAPPGNEKIETDSRRFRTKPVSNVNAALHCTLLVSVYWIWNRRSWAGTDEKMSRLQAKCSNTLQWTD